MKKFSKICAVGMTIATLLSVAACGPKGGGDVISNDENTLNVKIRKAGYGTSYIYELKEQFEKTFAEEGYKINVLAPREDLGASSVYREIYSGGGIDVYFTTDANAGVAVNGEYGKTTADITEGVFKKSAIKFDGSEETQTIEEKLSYYNMDSGLVGDKVYGIPYALSIGGLAVNKKVLQENGLEVPRTSKEMLDAADKIMETANSTDRFPFAFSLTGQNYVHSTLNAWIAQYGGIEEYNKIMSFDNADGTIMDNPEAVYEYDSLKYALEIIYNFYDYNMAAYGCSTSDFSTVQGKIMRGDATFMSVGDWMFNEEFERFTNYLNDVVFVNTPVISQLGIKLFGAGSSYNMSEDDADKTLSTIIKYADQNKLAEEIKPLVDQELGKNINLEDVKTVCERRGITRIRSACDLVVSEKSEKKDLANIFLRFCASEEAGQLFAKEARTISPYSYKVAVNSEYAWIKSASNVAMNPYLKLIDIAAQGTRKQLGVALFPNAGEFFSTGIYEQGVTRYDDSLKLVKGRDVYTTAVAAMLNAEYEYARDRISWSK